MIRRASAEIPEDVHKAIVESLEREKKGTIAESAMKIIDEIHSAGGRITSFQSHCGGLVAPESDDNPWRYKISWNPRSVVHAGKSGGHYKENGEEKRSSPLKILSDCVETLLSSVSFFWSNPPVA